ncbi:GntR family transcriptional regulator [Lactobacillus amylovorus]|uniref:GntR family transcriptional regulator n=1 Tax=Lactobacillus amylovorus TaxID=1604 RepID=UPI0003383690|nr:GntR family transcriptional regulator [Lactobacillus amylovorus]MCI1336692.1 GntR family transcriptional regulator [Lactobacillus crispatus]MCT3595106.1 GntR family transcriptional regulator [Lactobacillus amylovorus]MDB6220690.1 GntR family transcriptional regulator [Lactobacillus amylovorus]CDA27444.1 transcriptional regulator [Lactobacillus amylovorus CAG:719]
MPSPKYLEIQNLLLQRIKNGDYQEGQLIPKEVDLAEQLNVSRPTVRHAIRNLVQAGYLERRKKRGTIVTQTKIKQQFTHVIESYNTEIQNNGLVAKTQVLNFSTEKANDEVAEALTIKPNTEVYKLVRLRSADNKPVVFVITYLPIAQLPDLQKIDFTHHSLYSELAKAGLEITHVSRKIEVHPATEEEAQLLETDIKAPIFYFHTIGFTKDHRALEYSIASYRGDLNYFMVEIDKH